MDCPETSRKSFGRVPHMQYADIIKAELDSKEYKVVTLKNKVKCVLIANEKADMAAASLRVGVGSCMDPKEFPGLAHYLEHMVFMGTQKYPDENEYQKFIMDNGGSSNANTGLDYTNFNFHCSTEAFEASLDRFS